MKRYGVILFLTVLSLLPLWSFLHPGLPLTHDGQDHVARIANFYQSLTEGNLIPRWGANLNWGFGHPVLMFLYPLPSYVASVFHTLKLSLADSVKLVFALSFIASILSMYLWARKVLGVLPGVVAGVLYGFAPYRFVDMHVRGAIGEHAAFIFPPLILLGLSGLAGKKGYVWGVVTALATAGLLLSHNAISIMFAPLVAGYVLYLYRTESKGKVFLIRALGFLGTGFLVSSFFWFPAFFEGKYTLRDIVTEGESLSRFVPFAKFIRSEWNYGGTQLFSKEIGIVHWAGILLTVWFVYKEKNGKRRLLPLALLGVFAGSLFLMMEISSPVWKTVTILQKFQFPWRFLSVSVFSSAVIGGLAITYLPKRIQSIVATVFILGAVITTAHMWRPSAYKAYQESFFTGVYDSTTDTGESSPIWSVRFMEHRFSSPLEVIQGVIEADELERLSTYHHYTVRAHERSRLVENTLYFPGWTILIDNEPVAVEFQDSRYRGLMTFWVEPGMHDIQVRFVDTKLRMFANAISLLGVVALFGLYYAVIAKKL